MRNVCGLWEIWVVESRPISDDRFATETGIKVLTAHAQTPSSEKSHKVASRADITVMFQTRHWTDSEFACTTLSCLPRSLTCC